MYNTDMPTRAELPTTSQLLRSTLIAVVAAATLLITVVLPAEYGVDPTGIGDVLGLKEMGEIKMQLAEEAQLDAVPVIVAEIAAPPPTITEQVETPVEALPEVIAENAWQDTVVLTLKPGEAAEIKLEMNKDDLAEYEWTTNQGHLNSDLHADGTGGEFVSYRKGRKETSETGKLTAAFSGTHGWFWRNRSKLDVDVTLRVKGTYGEIIRVV